MARTAIPKAEYFELRAAALASESIELEAMKAAQEFGRRLAEAKERSNALFVALAKAHGLDLDAAYRFDDATCELIAEA